MVIITIVIITIILLLFNNYSLLFLYFLAGASNSKISRRFDKNQRCRTSKKCWIMNVLLLEVNFLIDIKIFSAYLN